MVKLILNSKRPAVAMIELIFSLVIMGIVMMSAPMLISTSNSSSSVGMQQEGINQAVSRINMIMGYAWDEQNTYNIYIPILHTTTPNTHLSMVTNTARRVGTPQESQRNYIFSDGNSSNLFASSTLGMETNDNNESDDIDDFIGNISLTGTKSTTDYVDTQINIQTEVQYTKDRLELGNYQRQVITYIPFKNSIVTNKSSNVKSIKVTLTSTDTINDEIFEKTIIFQAFSSNIGSYSLEEKVF